jgi:hypothetical protein
VKLREKAQERVERGKRAREDQKSRLSGGSSDDLARDYDIEEDVLDTEPSNNAPKNNNDAKKVKPAPKGQTMKDTLLSLRTKEEKTKHLEAMAKLNESEARKLESEARLKEANNNAVQAALFSNLMQAMLEKFK